MIVRPFRHVQALLTLVVVAGTLSVGSPPAAAAPGNDDRAAATTIEALPFETHTSNEGATEELGEHLACASTDLLHPYTGTVWFAFTAPGDVRVAIDTAGSGIDTVVSVYRDGARLPEACGNQHAHLTPTPLLLEADGGERYEIQIGGSYDQQGPIRLQLYEPTTPEPPPPSEGDDHPVTVVAVVDNGFSPYHYDFVGHQHPWNTDDDPLTSIDLFADPATYIEGHPGATAVPITIPTDPLESVGDLREGPDAPSWNGMEVSNTAADANVYWFPGTKVIGAVSFDGDLYGTNSSHGTRSAASAVGNIHGTCPTCLVVFVKGFSSDALRWAASQPWIDIVTNSYGHSTALRDNIYFGAPLDATKQASEDGGTVVFSAGNGHLNAFIAPPLTYWSSEKGPDWIVTVGAVTPGDKQSFSGHGKPVDVSSVGRAYPSTGGSTATGTGTHSGTSNAAPTVAGYFGSVVQGARERLGDRTAGRAGGVVASGEPVECGPVIPDCVLGDGVLTKTELDRLVYTGALPSAFSIDTSGLPNWPSTEYAYAYQGHGVLAGHLSDAGYEPEIDRMLAVATGEVATYERPDGESNWFTVDSKCRQRLWGAWSGGYYTGAEPILDPQADPLATVLNVLCTHFPQGPYVG